MHQRHDREQKHFQQKILIVKVIKEVLYGLNPAAPGSIDLCMLLGSMDF
jgi:hypothetical protein